MFQYKIPRTKFTVPSVPSRPPAKPAEVLIGKVQGKKAYKDEEYFARALDAMGMGYLFRYQISPLYGGSAKLINELGVVEVDFLVFDKSIIRPIQIDGKMAHFRAAWQRDIDAKKDIIVNNYFASRGGVPVQRIPYTKLLTPMQAQQTAREVLR